MNGGIDMNQNIYYRYYVEGENEKNLLEVLKSDLFFIRSGKIEKFNVVQKKFNKINIRTLKDNTIVVLVYDTDTEYTQILEQNLEFLKRQSAVKEIICIPQVYNLEDELIYACNIKNIKELTNSISNKNYKTDLNKCTNLDSRLKDCKFNIVKFWSKIPKNQFEKFGNAADKIKIRN